jgi:AcrR family transcriptional regulator
LTRLAGVSNGSFYSRFSGTDDCLLAAYEATMAAATRRIAGTRSVDLGPAAQLASSLEVMLDYFEADLVGARFALIEVYGGGPAALAAIDAAEKRLELAVRGCLDRRGRRVPPRMAATIVAATLHCARVGLLDRAPAEAAATRRALIEWATDVVETKEDYAAVVPDRRAVDGIPAWPVAAGATGEHDERNLILAAVLRLATPEGFFGLTATKVSSAAGVPASRFRRHFLDLTESYLAAVRRTCRAFFIELTEGPGSGRDSGASVMFALGQTSRRVALEPAAARLTFRGIVQPGVPGLTLREALISELAMACASGSADGSPSLAVRSEARAAALWADLAAAADSPAQTVPRARSATLE